MKLNVQAMEAIFSEDSEHIEAEIKHRTFPGWKRRVRQVAKTFDKGLESEKVKTRDCPQVDVDRDG